MLKKKWVWIVLVVVIVLIGSVTAAASMKKPGYIMANVTRNDITEIVAETGVITTSGSVSVMTPTTGLVEKVFVKNGDAVKAGAKLFTIKSTATEQEKAAALAAYLTAKAAVETANSNMLHVQAGMFSQWQSFRDLAQNDIYENGDGTPRHENRNLAEFHTSQKEWLAAENTYKNQEVIVNQAKAALSSALIQYQATQNATVKATSDGTVVNVSVTEKSPVIVSSTIPLAIITSSGVTEVVVPLSENNVAKVKEGQKAAVDVKAVHSKTYEAVVKRVDTIGTPENGVIRYNAYLEITNPDEQLRPGMKIDADITTNSKVQVLSVPNAAVKPYQGGRAVRWVGKNNKVEYKLVTIGIRGKENTEIIEGLSDNQAIILSLPNDQIKRPGLLGK